MKEVFPPTLPGFTRFNIVEINIKNIKITFPDYNINRVNITIDFGLSFEPDRFETVSISFDQFESTIKG